MTGFEGLGAELRKAVLTGREVDAWESKEVEKLNKTKSYERALVEVMNMEWLPAVLVEKEMRRIKEDFKQLLLEHATHTEYHEIDGKQATCLDKVFEKVEEVFGK